MSATSFSRNFYARAAYIRENTVSCLMGIKGSPAKLRHDCNTIDNSNYAFSILGFSLAGKRRVHVLIFSSIG